MTAKREATIDDLYKVEGKAEIVCGEIKYLMATGDEPGWAGDIIFAALLAYMRRTKRGRAVSDNKGFHVQLPNRKSFSPDAAYYFGPRFGMRFFEGAPAFAVEVRSENDYGPAAEREMAEKRADYFAAGAQVVWDVDLLSSHVVRKYTSARPETPMIFRKGEIADAEPAVPGWTMPVDDLFLTDEEE